MAKRYFEKPCVSVVRFTPDVIATSLGPNDQPGSGHPMTPARPYRRSIWD